MKKKVRLAIGTVGILPAAAAGVALAPTAHAAVVRDAAASPSATSPAAAAAAATWRNCNYLGYSRNIGTYSTGDGARFTGYDYYSAGHHSCVHFQKALLSKVENGLTERTRFRSRNNALLRTTWQAGKETKTTTYFSSTPNVSAYEICQALVANGNHNLIIYGPVCELNGAQ